MKTMPCPDLELLARHAADPTVDPALADHAAGCASCARSLRAVRQVDATLADPGLWGEEEGHLSDSGLLRALSGATTPLHLQGCGPCDEEVAAIRAVAADHERGAVPQPASDLRARLRRLAAAGSTTEDVPLPAQPRAPSSRRRSRTGRVTATGRAPGSGRRSGAGRASATGRVSRRRGVAAAATGPRVHQPVWAWGVLAAAAGLLVALAVALQEPRAPAGDGHVASGRPPGASPAPDRPTVADMAGTRADDGPTDDARSGAARADDPPGYLPEVAPDGPAPAREQPFDVPVVEPTREPGEGPADGSASDPGPTTAPRPTPADAPEAAADPSPTRPAVPDDGASVQVALGRLVGRVAVQARDGESWREHRRRDGALTLRTGDRIRTERGAFLSIDEGAYDLCLDAGSEVLVRGARGGPVLGLERGRLMAEVASLGRDERFVVATGAADFSVLGTRFAVEAPEAAADPADLLVVEGTVEARNTRGRVEVPAGLGVTVPRAAEPAEPTPADLSRLAWTQRLAPVREPVYGVVTFDDRVLGGFEGELTTEGALRGRGHALLFGPAPDGNTHWGLAARAPESRIGAFRAAPGLFVQLSVWSAEDAQVLFETYNATQDKAFKASYPVKAGRWRTITVPVMELTTYYDPGRNPVREGDLLTSLEVFAGAPGADHRVLLDEVTVYRKRYR